MLDVYENFDPEIKHAHEKFVLYFTGSWCIPCQAVKPIVEKVCEEFSTPIYKIECESYTDIALKYGIGSLPTIVIKRGHEELHRIVGKPVYSAIDGEIRGYLDDNA